MKRTVREDFRVRVVLSATNPAMLGLAVDGEIVSGRIEMVIEPRRLGDFGFGIVSDSLVSRDPAKAYERRANELAQDLRRLSQVVSATVEFSENTTCSHCGYPWEELTAEDFAKYPDMLSEADGDVIGLPQCCDQAQTEFRAAKAGAQ